ncbi:MAG: DUF3440 domain-containing protein [Kofleriaceae bacterium]
MARQGRKLSRFKRELDVDVLTAARARIAWTFDTFPSIYLSFSGGKDSSVMLHLVADEARRRGRRFGLLFIDLEAQYRLTIEHVQAQFDACADVCDLFWVALPIHLRNATSMTQPYWIAWDPDARDQWVRTPPPGAIVERARLPWSWPGMEFEEVIDLFGHWYGDGRPTACFVGIRSDESLDRWRTIARDKHSFGGRPWTTWKSRGLYNVYPIYDWRTEDLWTYVARTGATYNKVYDLMHQAGVSIHEQRICQPYGDDQRKGLWLYHVLEPEVWPRIVARVTGANAGALYAKERGNVLGRGTIACPPAHTWESYARFLLASLPPEEADHYLDKIAVFLHWYKERGYPDGIPDEGDPKLESQRKVPSWRRICKAILKNDRLCKSLGFSQQRSSMTTYEAYKRVMRKRRERWGLT